MKAQQVSAYVSPLPPPGGLDHLLPRADFVFLATPLTPETRNLLDARRQALMKRGAGVVNVGRAATMDYDALAANLRSGHLSGAVLDVFDPEPLASGSPLWSPPTSWSPRTCPPMTATPTSC